MHQVIVHLSRFRRRSFKVAVGLLLVLGIALPPAFVGRLVPPPRSGAAAPTADDYLVGAWYFPGWHNGYRGSLGRTGFECGQREDHWQRVKHTKPREVDFFYTLRDDERRAAEAGGFKPELYLNPPNPSTFDTDVYLYPTAQPGTVPLHRLRDSTGHYVTSSDAEKAEKLRSGYADGGIVGYLFSDQRPDTVALYRIELPGPVFQLTTDPDRVAYALRYTFTKTDWSQIVLQGFVPWAEQPGTARLHALYKPLPGQLQPRQPLVGYRPETAPGVMDQYIDWAADHGVDFFAFDWYWAPKAGCDRKLYLHEALEDAFLGSRNVARIKFAVAWFPFGQSDGRGYTYSLASAEGAIDYVLTAYAAHPSYLKIDGKPVVFLASGVLRQNFGNDYAQLTRLLTYGDEAARRLGYPGIYFVDVDGTDFGRLATVGFEAATWYSYVGRLSNFAERPCPNNADPTCLLAGDVKSYEASLAEYRALWRDYATAIAQGSPGVNFVPPLGAGWDRSPVPWIGYRSQILTGATPALFKRHLEDAKAFLDANPTSHPKMLVINAWNEWLEGSIIEPDIHWRCGFLEQVAAVFGSDRSAPPRAAMEATPATQRVGWRCDGATFGAAAGSPIPSAHRSPATAANPTLVDGDRLRAVKVVRDWIDHAEVGLRGSWLNGIPPAGTAGRRASTPRARRS